MKIPNRSGQFAFTLLTLLAITLFGTGIARAQYSPAGTTAGGGNIIVGNGTLGALGPGVPLSLGGFDQVTLNIGSMASASGQDTIQFGTSNDTMANNGTVAGAAGFNAISFISTSALAGETITNNGAITVGNFGAVISTTVGENSVNNAVGANAANGIAITSGGGISGLSLSNAGRITAGSFGDLSSSGPFSLVGFNEGSGDIGGNAATGVAITSGDGINGLSLSNAGTITAGSFGAISGNSLVGFNESDGDTGGNVGDGVAITSGSTISGLSLSSAGTITAGGFGAISGNSSVGYNESSDDIGGNAGTGIAITSGGAMSTLSLINQGAVTGGNFGNITSSNVGYNQTAGSVGANVGDGVAITTGGGISGLSLSNAGTITAGSFGAINGSNVGYNQDILGDYGANAGTGVAITSGGGITGLSITNTGAMHGGSFGDITNSSNVGYNQSNGDVGANAGVGLAITSGGAMNTVSLITQGTITGGNFGNITSSHAGYNQDFGIDVGGNAGTGIAITSGNTMNGLSLVNKGTVSGGSFGAVTSDARVGDNQSSGDIGGNAVVGIAITSGGGIAGFTFVNRGSVTGGSVGMVDSTSIVGHNGFTGNTGGNVATGVAITSGGAINGLAAVNFGTITGGSIAAGSTGTVGGNNDPGDIGGDAASGLAILSGAGSSNILVTNFGTITGGSAGANAGYGINAGTGNLVINNWGAVNAGSGASTATQAGFPALAISVSGNNNAINLNGHSSVNGTIQASGANNVLNLNFTGVNPQALANLKAQLTAQGWPGTNDFTGTFSLRGVTYFIDPLTLDINGITSYEGLVRTPNQFAIGVSLDSAAVNPPVGSPLFNLYNAIDLSGNVPAAIEALSPQKYEIYGDLAISNATAMAQNVDARLNNIRDGSESIDTTEMGGGTDTATAGYSKDDGKESKEVVTAPAPEKRWGMFASGEGLFFRGNSHDVDLQEGRSNTAGTVAGVDAKAGEHVILGALFAYDNADATLGSDGSHARIESYTGGLYGDWHQDGFYMNGLAAYSRNNYSSDRNIIFPGFAGEAGGNTHGNQATVNVDGGYDWHVTDRLTVGPLAGLQYVNLGVNGFNETGTGAADLALGSQRMNSLQSRVGGRMNFHLLDRATTSFAADFHAAWQHEFLDDSRAINGGFIGTGLAPFSIQTSAPLRDAAAVGMGLNFTFHDRLTLFADYELLFWRASYFEQTVNSGVRLSF